MILFLTVGYSEGQQPLSGSPLQQDSPTATPPQIVITKLNGEEVRVSSIESSELELLSGVYAWFDYITQVEFSGDEPAYRDTTITFYDGTEWHDIMYSDTIIRGEWVLGSVDISVSEIASIVIERETPLLPSPASQDYPRLTVTTQDGVEVNVVRAYLSLDSYTLNSPSGIPLKNGLEVRLDYISRVEYGEPDQGERSVILTLVDGSELHGVASQVKGGTKFEGRWQLGDVELGSFVGWLSEIRSIDIQHDTTVATIPESPPTSDIYATLLYTDGSSLEISQLQFTVVCISGNWCCYGDTLPYMPTIEGYNIEFSKVAEIEFFHDPERHGIPLPVKVTSLDGQVFEFTTQPVEPCQFDEWRLIGHAALGYVDVGVTEVSKLVFSSSGE